MQCGCCLWIGSCGDIASTTTAASDITVITARRGGFSLLEGGMEGIADSCDRRRRRRRERRARPVIGLVYLRLVLLLLLSLGLGLAAAAFL